MSGSTDRTDIVFSVFIEDRVTTDCTPDMNTVPMFYMMFCHYLYPIKDDDNPIRTKTVRIIPMTAGREVTEFTIVIVALTDCAAGLDIVEIEPVM